MFQHLKQSKNGKFGDWAEHSRTYDGKIKYREQSAMQAAGEINNKPECRQIERAVKNKMDYLGKQPSFSQYRN